MDLEASVKRYRENVFDFCKQECGDCPAFGVDCDVTWSDHPEAREHCYSIILETYKGEQQLTTAIWAICLFVGSVIAIQVIKLITEAM